MYYKKTKLQSKLKKGEYVNIDKIKTVNQRNKFKTTAKFMSGTGRMIG